MILIYASILLFIVGSLLSMRGKRGFDRPGPVGAAIGAIALALFMLGTVWIIIQKFLN